MAPFILFDDTFRNNFLPFAHTRPCADLLCGSFTFRERWERLLGISSSTLTESYLTVAYPILHSTPNYYVNGLAVGTTALTTAVQNLKSGECIFQEDRLIALCSTEAFNTIEALLDAAKNATVIPFNESITTLSQVWDLFKTNEQLLKEDFALITQNKKAFHAHATLVNAHDIFIEEGAVIGAGVILNATDGPIFIAAGSEIMDGAIIRGPFTMRAGAAIKMAAKIYGACTIGPGCKVGGEVGNTIFLANSNKGHDGYLGNSVIGEWCNLGADTNSSNLKNNYDTIKIWDEHTNKSVQTGLQFCGLLMGDHSKCGINTMFNTGTVVGVSANIFGAGFPQKFIPSFSWGGAEGQTTYQLNRAIDTANRVMARRGLTLSDAQVQVLNYIFDKTQKQRDIFLTP